jgi:RNA polymerase sigma-70 factor (ECF subfamily)
VDSSTNNPAGRAWELLNQLSDEKLALEVLGGAHDALAVLFDRYHTLVFGVAYNIVHNASEAEEVVQTVFLEAFRALVNFDPARGTFRVWLSQFAYSRALNQRRHLIARRFYDLVSLEAAVADSLCSQEAACPDTVRLAEELLDSLNERRRAVVELTYFQGLTAKEVSEQMGISAENVRHELYRGLAKLREAVRLTRRGKPTKSKAAYHQSEGEVLTPDAQPL